jgi:phosphoribosylformylglycinamidine (FGAM) synthase PurS component
VTETTVARAYVVSLTIPDNEAYTALTTLARMGLAVDAVVRADVWLLTLDAERAAAVDAIVPTIEGIFNPNKHRLEIRSDAAPRTGEVWVMARDETPTITIGGRAVDGVHGASRRTAWRLLDARGHDVAPGVLGQATETFLCNPAFQKALLP